MSIKKFQEKYSSVKTSSIELVAKRWKLEKEVDDFLGAQIAGGVFVYEILTKDKYIDLIPEDIRDAFKNLMKNKADSYDEIRNLIVEKYEKSDASVQGLISKIQGQYGENEFLEVMEGKASLATDGSQEGWDVKIPHEDYDQYIQVKVYKDSSSVIDHIEKVNEKVNNGIIENVDRIDFAVNSDIYDEVKERVSELGLPNEIMSIGKTRDEIRDRLTGGFEDINESGLFDELFTDLFSSALNGAAIHAAANAFLVWKCGKEKSQAIEDTLYSSIYSGGGLAASLGTRSAVVELAALTELEIVGSLLGPVGLVAGVGVGYGTREFLKRIGERKDLVGKLDADRSFNEFLINRL